MDAFKMEKGQGLLLCLRDLQESPKGAAPLALSQKPLVASDRMEMCPAPAPRPPPLISSPPISWLEMQP